MNNPTNILECFHIFMHLGMGAHEWFGTNIHPIWKNLMQMKGNGPWGFTSTPQLCKAFSKEPIGRFWGKLWISITSHQFLAWSWQNSYVLANHTHPFHPIFHLLQLLVGQLWRCKGRGGGDVTTRQVHPWKLWDQRCQGTFMGVE